MPSKKPDQDIKDEAEYRKRMRQWQDYLADLSDIGKLEKELKDLHNSRADAFDCGDTKKVLSSFAQETDKCEQIIERAEKIQVAKIAEYMHYCWQNH